MFIINPYLRFALMFLGIVGGIALWSAYGFWYGFFFLLTGVVLLIGYLLFGTVASAAKALQVQDFDKAEKLLGLTPSPRLLFKSNRAYYYMLHGNIALSRKDMAKGEAFLRQAEAVDIPTANERAMLQLQLAQIEASRGRMTQANQHLKKAKDAGSTLPQVKEQVVMVEKALKQQGQVKGVQRMGRQGHQMMSRGGKRRRPKMR
ncbi:MAG: hypothetical protein AAFO91_06835 [Bacteroidota bacterium]